MRAAMTAQGISDVALAAVVGVTKSAIGKLWKPETQQSRLVPAIHAALKKSPPKIDREDAQLMKDIAEDWDQIDETGRKIVRNLIKELARRR